MRRRQRLLEPALRAGLEPLDERLRVFRLDGVRLRLRLGATRALRELPPLLRPSRLGSHVFAVERRAGGSHIRKRLLVLGDVDRHLLELLLLGCEVRDDARERAIGGCALLPRALRLGVGGGGDGGVIVRARGLHLLAGSGSRRLDVEGHRGRVEARRSVEGSLQRADSREERVAFPAQPLHRSHGVAVHGGRHDGLRRRGDGGRRGDRAVRRGVVPRGLRERALRRRRRSLRDGRGERGRCGRRDGRGGRARRGNRLGLRREQRLLLLLRHVRERLLLLLGHALESLLLLLGHLGHHALRLGSLSLRGGLSRGSLGVGLGESLRTLGLGECDRLGDGWVHRGARGLRHLVHARGLRLGREGMRDAALLSLRQALLAQDELLLTLRELLERLLLLIGHPREHLLLLSGHLREHLLSRHLLRSLRHRLLLHRRRHLLHGGAHHSLVVSILEAHDLLPRARQLLLKLGNLRRARSLRLAAPRGRNRGGDGGGGGGSVVGLLLLLLLLLSLRRTHRGHETVDAGPAALQPLERLRESLLQLLVRSLELLDGAGADANRGIVPNRRLLLTLRVATRRSVVSNEILLEDGVVAEPERVGVLLEHGELPGGEPEPRGVFALPLGAIPELVSKSPPVLLEVGNFPLELRVERPELRRLHLRLELEPAEVDVGVLGDARLLTQETGLLGEILDFTTERVGLRHGVLNLLIRSPHLHPERLEVAHRLREAVHASLVLRESPLRLREVLLRVVQSLVHGPEPLGLSLKRLLLNANLRLEVGVVLRLALERDVNLAPDVPLELIVRLEQQHAQVPELGNLRLELLDVSRVLGVRLARTAHVPRGVERLPAPR